MHRSPVVLFLAVALVVPGLSAAVAAPTTSSAPAQAAVPELPPQARVDTPDAHAHEDSVLHDAAKEEALRRRTKDAIGADVQAALAAAVAPPQQAGQWGPLTAWPVVGVHTALLPNGNVLSFDSIGDRATENYNTHDRTRASVWNPVTGTHTPVDVTTGYNIFCAGLAHLPGGEVFLAGGNKDNQLNGIVQTHLFDPTSQTWSLGSNMAYERWYPTVTPLPNGETLITGGRPSIPEVRSTSGALRALTGASKGLPLYPWLDVAPDGRVFYSGPDNQMLALSTADSGAWQSLGAGDGDRDYGSHAVYDIGKILVAGGGPSRRDASVIDINGTTPVRTATGSMGTGRRQHNVTILADGSVLATGGNSSGAGLVDLQAGVYAAERWNPTTGTWTMMAAQSQTRQYHSTALLLPDGRVLSAGGGLCGTCDSVGYLAKDAEVYSPPYLFDANGQPAQRPTISTAPGSVSYADPFTVTTPQAGAIGKVALIRINAVTHSVDMEQRYVPLAFTQDGSGGLAVTGPRNANIAPPGVYMLTVVDSSGVPSEAKMVNVGTSPTAPTAPNVQLTSPANGATFTAPATVGLTATASDPDGIAKVEFLNGSTKIGEDLTSPYGYTWSGVAAGDYSLTARATDSTGLATTTSATTISVTPASTTPNAAPTAEITSALPQASGPRKTTIVINAAASDTDGAVAKVEFFRADGATRLGEDATAPYSYTWRNPPSGTHLLRVRATDNAGALSQLSQAVPVTVQR